MQEDVKKLIAYSSVAHMASSPWASSRHHAGRGRRRVPDGVARIVSGALFLCVGIVYDRMHTRDRCLCGLVNRMPLYALVFMVFTMANVGLPGTSASSVNS